MTTTTRKRQNITKSETGSLKSTWTIHYLINDISMHKKII